MTGTVEDLNSGGNDLSQGNEQNISNASPFISNENESVEVSPFDVIDDYVVDTMNRKLWNNPEFGDAQKREINDLLQTFRVFENQVPNIRVGKPKSKLEEDGYGTPAGKRTDIFPVQTPSKSMDILIYSVSDHEKSYLLDQFYYVEQDYITSGRVELGRLDTRTNRQDTKYDSWESLQRRSREYGNMQRERLGELEVRFSGGAGFKIANYASGRMSLSIIDTNGDYLTERPVDLGDKIDFDELKNDVYKKLRRAQYSN